MRLIDADALKENCYIKVGDTTIGRRQYAMFHEIDDAPTIDAVSVVRCKECKHYHADKYYGFCSVINVKGSRPKPMDYCSYGRRKTEPQTDCAWK